MSSTGIEIEKADGNRMVLDHLILDFNGTLAVDGELIQGVAEKLGTLSQLLIVTVLTSDTFGTAQAALKGLPVKIQIVRSGWEKGQFLNSLSSKSLVAIGNGKNDIEMFKRAELSIAVLGTEGMAAGLLSVAHVVVVSIHDALDLLSRPKRILATLKE